MKKISTIWLPVIRSSCLVLMTFNCSLNVSPVVAGGLYLNEFASTSMGTAGAGQEAYANDASTSFAFNNPAGMTRLDGHHLSAGIGLLSASNKFDADDNTAFSGGNGGEQGSLAPLLGSYGVLSVADDLKLGMSMFSISGASLDPSNDWAGRYQLEEINLLTVTVNPSVAYRITDELSVGAGFAAMYVRLNYELAAPPVNPPAGGDSQVDIDGSDWAYGFNLGALVEVSPQTRFGITYVSEIEPKFSGNLDVRTGKGPTFTADSDLEFTFPQTVHIGAYHEVNEQWALLGSVGWEDWSSFNRLDISTGTGGQSIDTNWRDTYFFGGGVHYRPIPTWLLQAGLRYDTSPVSDGNRTANLPSDRQIRVSIGTQYGLSKRMSIGGAFEYIDLGDARIDSPTLQGDYQRNHVLAFALYLNYQFGSDSLF